MSLKCISIICLAFVLLEVSGGSSETKDGTTLHNGKNESPILHAIINDGLSTDFGSRSHRSMGKGKWNSRTRHRVASQQSLQQQLPQQPTSSSINNNNNHEDDLMEKVASLEVLQDNEHENRENNADEQNGGSEGGEDEFGVDRVGSISDLRQKVIMMALAQQQAAQAQAQGGQGGGEMWGGYAGSPSANGWQRPIPTQPGGWGQQGGGGSSGWGMSGGGGWGQGSGGWGGGSVGGAKVICYQCTVNT